MAKGLRPRSLAAGFGVYFLVIAFIAWGDAQSQGLWFEKDITRWVYTTYMLVAAIFLVGLGGLGVSVRRSFTRQIHELDRRSASRNPGSEGLPPPLPETTAVRDHVDRDIDELLESLSEIEQTTAQDAAAMDMGGSGEGQVRMTDFRSDCHRRDALGMALNTLRHVRPDYKTRWQG